MLVVHIFCVPSPARFFFLSNNSSCPSSLLVRLVCCLLEFHSCSIFCSWTIFFSLLVLSSLCLLTLFLFFIHSSCWQPKGKKRKTKKKTKRILDGFLNESNFQLLSLQRQTLYDASLENVQFFSCLLPRFFFLLLNIQLLFLLLLLLLLHPFAFYFLYSTKQRRRKKDHI